MNEMFVTERVINIITLKISSGLSIMGSGYILQDVLRNPKKRNESTYHRIMLVLSCSDIIFSFFGPFLGTWVMAKGADLFAFGSETTCIVTGSLASMGILSVPLYNCSLAIFYLLKLKLSWTNRKIKAIEKWLLFLPVTVGLIAVISAAAIDGIGISNYVCM